MLQLALILLLTSSSTALSSSTATRASAQTREGEETQWAPTEKVSALHARTVSRGETRSEAGAYAREGRESAAGPTFQRWYLEEVGQFVSPDSVGAASYLTTPNGLGPWSYANNSPLMYVDPDGRCWFAPGTDGISCLDAKEVRRGTARWMWNASQKLSEVSPAFGPMKLIAAAPMTAFANQSDEGELEAEHTLNSINPVYGALAHGKAMLDIDAQRKAEGGYTWSTAGAMVENALSFGFDVSPVLAPVARMVRAPASSNWGAVADAQLVEARTSLAQTIEEMQATRARRYAASRVESAQLYRELGGGSPPTINEPLRLAAGSVPTPELFGTTPIPEGTNLAFGMSGENLEGFATSQQGVSVFGAWDKGYHQLAVGDLRILQGNFEKIVNAFIVNGGRIKVNLTGLRPGLEGATTWELRKILANRQWAASADFFRNGELLTGVALEEALKPWR